MEKLKLWLRAVRAPFFTATIVPVLLGSAVAWNNTGFFSWPLFFITLVGAVFIHAAVNLSNDYFDHISGNDEANLISIRIQPKEGISFRIFTKAPGLTYEINPSQMEFSYSNSYKKEIHDSYQKILIDSMMADQTLFATSAGFGATWEFITSILKGWEKQPFDAAQGKDEPKFPNYKAGTWGPEEATLLIERDGRKWII